MDEKPLALSAVPNASYRTCTAPCFTSITLNGSPNSTGSSVFYDYNSDSIYVGDNNGAIHKFINVFVAGTPSEIIGGGTTSGWPQTVHTGAMPSGVLDPVTNYFIVGTGTQVARIPASGGSSNVIKTAALRTACGFLSPPVVDVVVGRAYFTLSDYNGTAAVGSCGSATGGPAIVQVSTTFTAGSSPIAVVQLPNGTARNVNISSSFGNFDYSYYNSAPGNPSGKFYACLYAPNPKLVQFTITNNVLTSTFINGPSIATATGGSPQPSCSPIVEFFDGTTDRIFTGVYTGQVATNGTYTCGNITNTAVGSGCVISYNVTQPFTFSATTAPQAVLPVAGGGASGIIIDNRASGGGSQIYFQSIMPQVCNGNGTIGAGTGYCAIQASQNGLN